MVIVSREIYKTDSMHWFRQFSKFAAVFTLISAADVEILGFLSSKFAGLDILSAPFSPDAHSLIFWCSCLNLLIEDLPQFIIQVRVTISQ